MLRPGAAAPPGPDTSSSRPHILAFDLIRVLIVAFVVAVHTLANAGGHVTLALGSVSTVFHTSRELFFLLTAFVLTYNYGRRGGIRWLAFWRRRYRLVIPAYLAWSVIYYAADGDRLDPVTAAAVSLGRDLLTGNARYQLYFLLVTMQVYLVFPLLRWLLRATAGHHLALFLAAGAYQLALTVAIQQHAVTTGPIGAWLHKPNALLASYLLYVIAGAIGAWHFDRLVAFTRRHSAAALAALPAGVGAGLGTYFAQITFGGQSPAAASAVFQPVVVVESLLIGWALFALGLRWVSAGARHRRLISTGADSSFGIFLAHPLVLQGVIALAGATGVLTAVRHAPGAGELAALLLIGLPLVYGMSWALVFLARRTPLSLVLTGRPRARRGQDGLPAAVTHPPGGPAASHPEQENPCARSATHATSPSRPATSTPPSTSTSAAWASSSPAATRTG